MTDDPLIGLQLANFRLDRILGRGGMAQVYYAWDVKLERPVAVKVIDARFRNNPAYARRFVHEAQAVAAWRHENIAQIFYADEQAGLYFFAMEYLDGLDLGRVLTNYAAKNELMPQADVLQIGRAIASALDYAHARNVVHRDVKPSNVIISREGRIVLTDFGLALDVEQGSVGEVFGSAHYIAPEQARRSSDATALSDLYSLGILLYEMLTGMVPFDDPSPTAVALQHLTQPPPPPRALNPNLSEEVEAVVLKAIHKTPVERYQSGAEFVAALEQAFKVGTTTTQPIPLPPPPAGMQGQVQAVHPARMTVSEVIASHVPPAEITATGMAPHPTNPSHERALPQRHSVLGWVVGGCSLIFAVLVGITAFILANSANQLAQNTTVPANLGETPLNLESPTLFTGVQVTAAPIAATLSTLPTVKYPDGNLFKLLYDDSSFYLLNLSDQAIPINWIAFERLSFEDVPLNRFNGTRWAEFYADSLPDRCMALRILGSPAYLDPPECGNNNFLSLRTPTRDDATVFWTAQEGSELFRVLWRAGGVDEEVARCEISAGTCEVFVP